MRAGVRVRVSACRSRCQLLSLRTIHATQMDMHIHTQARDFACTAATYLANHVCTVTAASERVHVPLLAVVRRDVVAHVRDEVEPAVGDVISWNGIGCCCWCLCVALAIKSINYLII